MSKKEEALFSKEEKEKIEHLRKEYYGYKAPKELKERIKIMKEKRKEKNKAVWIGVRVLGGVVAAMLAIIVLVNSDKEIAMAIQKVPAIGEIAKVVTFRTYENDTEGNEAKVEIPKIDEKSEAAQKVNKSMEDYVNQLIAEYEKDIEQSKEYTDEAKESLDTQYTVLTNTEKLLSVRLDSVIVMASGYEFSKIYHIDKLNDKEVTLKDLFIEDSDYIKIISDNIKKQMREQMKKDKGVTYFLDSEEPDWDFKQIKKDQNFYINDKNQLVIVFDEYEVAPGCMGPVEFTINESVVQNLLTSFGKSLLK